MMPGGSEESWKTLKPIFESIAAKAEGEPCANKGFKVGITKLGDEDTIAPAVQKGMMRRKSNSVLLTERSSLQLYMAATNAPESVKQMVLDPKEYAMLGGGFPICVEEVGVVATVAVSGMGQVSDHDVIVKCISKYLHIDEVPRIRTV